VYNVQLLYYVHCVDCARKKKKAFHTKWNVA
jgi:hypothetical protein